VSGATTTLDTATLEVQDNNIVVSKGNVTSAPINGAGITLESAGDNATITYNTTGPKFEMKLGSNYEDLKVDTLIGDVTGDVTGDLTGNADTVTTNANLTGHITSSGNAAVLGSFTSAQLKTALTNETGSGAAVFATSPTLVTPALGTPASGVMTNVTGTATNLNIGGNAATATNLVASTSSVVALGSINMGHASDTTIARSAAGRVTIEGQQIATSKKFALAHATTGVAGNNSGTNDTVFTITHGMGDQLEYMVQVIAASGGATVFPCVTRTTTTVVITFNVATAQSAYTALLVKI
jgi:hypothetical protein